MISGLILAAGEGRPTGNAKPILPYELAALIDHTIANLRDSKLDELILILGHDARRMVQKLSIGGLKVVINPTPSLGVSTSIQRGLAHINDQSEAVMLAKGRMPLVTGAFVDQMIASYSKGKKGIVAPVHDGTRGFPVLLNKEKYFDSFLALNGNVGIEPILEQNLKDILEVKCKTDDVLVEINTHEELEAVKDRVDLQFGAYTFA